MLFLMVSMSAIASMHTAEEQQPTTDPAVFDQEEARKLGAKADHCRTEHVHQRWKPSRTVRCNDGAEKGIILARQSQEVYADPALVS